MSSRLSFRPARVTIAILGLTTVVSCSGSTTLPTPVPTVPSETPSSTPLLWPLAGQDGRDWVINNYVDLDATSGTRDYTGATGSAAKTIDGHSGIDIDVPSFRWMDGNFSNVLAAASGVVTAVRDTEPDRNTSCTGTANLVQVRHPDGLTAIYGHLKKGSVPVSIGQQVSVGAILGVVGSSGCSTAPHLHLELHDAANRVVDPFRNGLWAAPPIYNTAITLMDLVLAQGDMTLQQIKDPAPNVQSIPRGAVRRHQRADFGAGVSRQAHQATFSITGPHANR